MIKYITDLHLVGLPFIDEPTMENVHNIVNKGDILIIGGDIFNSYAVGASNSTFYDHIIKLSEICEHIYLLTGNHDDNQGVCSFRLFDYAKDNVSIIPDYQVVKIGDVNYHFLNHFRHYPKFNNLILEGTNILFSHAEINNESEIPKSFLKFDRVYNGHIHDFGTFGNVVNTGAFRQTKKNESTIRHYLEIDGASYIKYDVKTPVVVKEVLFSDMDALVDEPSMIKVIVKSKEERERFHELKDVYKNIHFKVESHINPEIQVSAVKQEVKNGLDVKDVFKDYYKEFCAKFDFKTDVKKPDLFNLFAKVCGEVKDSEILDFKIDSLYLKNFKLFEELSLDFMQNKAGLTLVKGINNDEIVDGRVSSNESGKTVIRQAIEYALIGAEAKVTPLRNGESSGEVDFGFSVKGDSVRFMRSYTEKKNDLRISINKEEFGKDMTMTEKLDAFFEKYPVNKYMDFILLYSRDWVGNFFNPKSNQKAKILAEMFPNLLSIPGKVVKDIQAKTKTLQDSYNMQLQAYESSKMKRSVAVKGFKDERSLILGFLNKSIKEAQGYQGMIDSEPVIDNPKYTMDALNSYRKYLSATTVVSPYGHTSEIDINTAFEKIKAHELYLKKSALLESIGDNIKYVEPYLRGELKKDTSELSRQSAILSNKITEERNRYEKEFNKLSSAGVCHTCGSIPSVEKQQEIKAEIEKELLRIKEYGLSLAKELSEKESVLKEIESYNANFEVVYKALSKYDRNQLQLVTAEVEKDEEFEKHKWEKENGYAFNNWLKLNEERQKMSIPADINIDKEVENIAAYNNRAFKISNYENMKNRSLVDIEKMKGNYNILLSKISEFNKASKDELKANTKDAILEELKVAKVLSEVLSSKKTLNFENYFVSMFLEKVQSIITTFLSMLFTREVYLEVTDCDLQFFDEGRVRTYNDFSKGARTKIEIALVLALGLIQMDYGFSTSFMFIDEFLDEGVDETNIKRVVELLRRCYSEVDHLYLVSHKQIEDIVDHTLLINRQGGKSTCLY